MPFLIVSVICPWTTRDLDRLTHARRVLPSSYPLPMFLTRSEYGEVLF